MIQSFNFGFQVYIVWRTQDSFQKR